MELHIANATQNMAYNVQGAQVAHLEEILNLNCKR